MSFHNHNVLIACSDKKDRLQFFNYFDDLDAEKIFTASDVAQMHELLENDEEGFTILAFEISSHWIKNLEAIKNIKSTRSDLKLIALVAMRRRAVAQARTDDLFDLPPVQVDTGPEAHQRSIR